MSGINQMEYFQSIVDEFSGTEFTTEDLKKRFAETIYNSDEEIDERVWISGNKFSIIGVEEYPELSGEELQMLSEIMELYGYIPCGCFGSSKFIQDLQKAKFPRSERDEKGYNRKNILQWYTSLFPTEDQRNENALDCSKQLKSLREFSRRGRILWSELYTNEEYCKKIIEKDNETFKKWREDEIIHLRGLGTKPICPNTALIAFRNNEEIFNYYGLNTPTSDDNSD